MLEACENAGRIVRAERSGQSQHVQGGIAFSLTSFFARGQRAFKLVLKLSKEEEEKGRERERERKRKKKEKNEESGRTVKAGRPG